jgi:3-oxo-5-alpha-steroid 4-dehydrogenase 1
MNERGIYNVLIVAWFVLAAGTFAALFFVVVPYGRHVRRGWGPTIASRPGWILMEAPAPLAFAACFVFGQRGDLVMALAFFGLWEGHYVHRAFVYPLERRDRSQSMPLSVVGLGFGFNALNGYINGRYLYGFGAAHGLLWLHDARFWVGLALFLAGYVTNRWADRALRALRRAGDTGYYLPQRGLYRWIDCPNYLGEIVEWSGWALATWSLPGLAFVLWTAANLVPRARAHHAWYRQQFAAYPPERKALLPGIW